MLYTEHSMFNFVSTVLQQLLLNYEVSAQWISSGPTNLAWFCSTAVDV